MFPWWKLLVTQENDGDGLGESFYFHLKTRKASENLCHKQTIQGLCDNNPRHSARPKTSRDSHWQIPETPWHMKNQGGSFASPGQLTACPFIWSKHSLKSNWVRKENWKNKGRSGFSPCYLRLLCWLLLYELKDFEQTHRRVELDSLQPGLRYVVWGWR